MAFTIEQIAYGVRNALYGREVREWLAQLGEYCVTLVQKAESAVKEAKASADAAKNSEDNAKKSADSAKTSADNAAESEANAKYHADSAASSAERSEAVIERMSDINGGYFVATDMTIPKSAWKKTDTWNLYPYEAAMADAVANATLEPQAVVKPESTLVAQNAFLACMCETGDKVVKFWAAHEPTDNINIRLILFGIEGVEGASMEAVVSDTIGLSVADGKIHVTYEKE